MPNILLVDDSLVDRRLVTGVIQQASDCTVAEADSAETALEQLEQVGEPDLVLTDLQMPGLNGLELVERIRNDWPCLPVILITAAGSEDIAAQALKVGAASYVPKKRLQEDLIPTMQRILAAAREERTHSRLMHHLTRGELDLDLRNDTALIHPLVRMIQEMLRSLPLGDESERLRVGVAVEEAIKNGIYRGNLEIGSIVEEGRTLDELVRARLWTPPYCNRRVNVNVAVSHEEATFTVTDEGPGFDPSPFETGDFNGDNPLGRGIRLMRTFMDEVSFENNGRCVVLKKHRYEEPALDDVEEQQ